VHAKIQHYSWKGSSKIRSFYNIFFYFMPASVAGCAPACSCYYWWMLWICCLYRSINYATTSKTGF